MAKIIHETPNPIVSVTLHPTGRMFLATEKAMYELDSTGVWNPMRFSVPDPVVPEPKPAPSAVTKVAEPVA